MEEARKEFELLCPLNGLKKDNPIILSANAGVVYRDAKTQQAWRFFLKGWRAKSKALTKNSEQAA